VTSPRATFLHYLGQHKLRLALGVAVVGLSAFVAVLAPLLIGRIVDALTQGSGLEVVLRLAALMVVLSAIESTLRGFGRWRILDASRRIEYRMRNDLLAHLQTMHLAYFQHQRIGDLMARLTNDLQAVRQMVEEATSAHDKVIAEMHKDAETATKAGDIGTADLFTRLVQQHQKQRWFLREILRRD